MVLIGIGAGFLMLSIDRSGIIPRGVIEGPWLYNGGGTGARTLLGAVASSTIGVAGTVFSITIAALSLAAGQMGPRLLRNFTKDRGNQLTLGAFLGTFSYALIVLRSVRTQSEGEFVPHLSLTVAILLAFVCVGTLVYFVGHMAGRINVDTVIELVSAEVSAAIRRLTVEEPGGGAARRRDLARRAGSRRHAPRLPSAARRRGPRRVGGRARCRDPAADPPGRVRLSGRADRARDPRDRRHGDRDRGRDRGRPAAGELGRSRIRRATTSRGRGAGAVARHQRPAHGDQRAGPVGSRPVRDRAPRHLATGVHIRDGRTVLLVPSVEYGGLADAMFHMIRQNAAGSPAVLIRMVEVLTAVATCERSPERVPELARHADLVRDDATRDVANPADLADIDARHQRFVAVASQGPRGLRNIPEARAWTP